MVSRRKKNILKLIKKDYAKKLEIYRLGLIMIQMKIYINNLRLKNKSSEILNQLQNIWYLCQKVKLDVFQL